MRHQQLGNYHQVDNFCRMENLDTDFFIHCTNDKGSKKVGIWKKSKLLLQMIRQY